MSSHAPTQDHATTADDAFATPDQLAELLGGRVPLAAEALAAPTPQDAARAAQGIGFPVALKAVAPHVVHKSEMGAVRLGLADADAVQAAAAEMQDALGELSGFQVQEMAPSGVELIVGAKRDPVFGPVVLAGLGGVTAELLGDVSVRLAPVDLATARAMLGELRGAALLGAFRGGEPRDLQALAETIVAVSEIAAERDDLLELDLNPVIALPDRAVVVDARARLGRLDLPPAREPLSPDAAAALLRPRSVVVVGASREVRKQGGRLLHYLVKHGFPGKLYAVNPSADEVLGQPCFPSIEALPEAPDLACIVLPAARVPDAVRACGAKGVKAAIVMTSGFAEAGEEGQRLDEQLLAAAREAGVRLCGPNTAGLMNADASLVAAISMAFEIEQVPRGDVAFVTQSGALGSALMSRSWEQGAGFSAWICAGNEIDLTAGDYLCALAGDPAVRVIALFLESVRDPQRFREGCERARAAGKPVVVFKTGYSRAGRRAVESHTAALAGDGVVYDAALRRFGATRATTLQGLVDAAVALARQPAPAGHRIGVVSASGGACSVIADLADAAGFEVPSLDEDDRRRIEAIVPSFASADNPVDVSMEVTTRPEMVGEVAEVMLACDVDALVVLMTTNADPPAAVVAEAVARVAATATKPILVVRVGADFLAPRALEVYREARIPLFPAPDRAIAALAAMHESAAARPNEQETV